jgi:hypothetical protein
MSSLECLAQAARLDDQAGQLPSEKLRIDAAETADGWRWVAALAGRQETWEVTRMSAEDATESNEGLSAGNDNSWQDEFDRLLDAAVARQKPSEKSSPTAVRPIADIR